MRGAALLAVVGVAVAGVTAGCNVSFPDEFLIEDLRVLDIQTTPPEVAVFTQTTSIGPDGTITNFGIQTTKVTYDALVAHPDLDAAFVFRWSGWLPTLRSIPCNADPIVDLDRRAIPERTMRSSPVEILSESLFDSMQGMIDPMMLGASLGQTLAQDPRDLLNGLHAHTNVVVSVSTAAVDVDTLTLEATKRVVVYDPTLIKLVIQQISQADTSQIPMIEGLDLPTLCRGATAGQLSAIDNFLETRVPNQAPDYESVEWTRVGGGTETATKTYDGTPIVIAPGQQVRFNGVTPESTAETFGVIDANCELQEFEERFGFSWFISKGELSRQLTTKGTPFVIYTAPSASDLEQAATPVRLWSVLRDGRGGSARQIVELRVEK